MAQGGTGGGGSARGGGGAGLGGALFVANGASLSVNNVTLTGNSALGGAGGNATSIDSSGGGGGLGGNGASSSSDEFSGGGGGLGIGADGGSGSLSSAGRDGAAGIALLAAKRRRRSRGDRRPQRRRRRRRRRRRLPSPAAAAASLAAPAAAALAATAAAAALVAAAAAATAALAAAVASAAAAAAAGAAAAAAASAAAAAATAAMAMPAAAASAARRRQLDAGGGGLGAGGAIFVQQGGTFTVDGPLTINGNSVTPRARGRPGTAGSAFGSGMFLQGSGTVTFSPGSSQTQTIYNVIADEAGNGGAAVNQWALHKTGAGTLVLGADNSYTGGTTVDGGTVELGTGGNLAAAGALTVNSGLFNLNDNNQTVSSLSGTGGTIDLCTCTLTVDQSGETSYAGTIIGTGGGGFLTKDGIGKLTLSGTNTFSAGTNLDGGTLSISSDANWATAAGSPWRPGPPSMSPPAAAIPTTSRWRAIPSSTSPPARP